MTSRGVLSRRHLLMLGASTASAALLSGRAVAKAAYPSRTITIVCAFPAGSGADVLVRYFADRMGKVSGATVIVENRAGAAGNIAAVYTARSKPDGYTIFIHSGSSIAGNMSLFKKPPIDVRTDLQAAALINKQAFMFVVKPDGPITNMKDLTAHLKKRGGDATYAVAATSGKVLGAQYKEIAGVQAVEVSYKDANDSTNDLLSGQLDYGVHDPVYCLSQAKQGRLRIIGIGSGDRISSIPDIPTLREQGYDIEQLGWFGVFLPAGAPGDVVDTINGWFTTILSTPETKTFLGNFGGDVYIGTPKEAHALLVKTVDQWKELVAIAKIPQN